MNSCQRILQQLLGGLLVIVGLEVQPDLGGPAEVAFEPQGAIDRERPLALHDFIDAPGRDADVFSHPVFRKTEGDQEVLAENFAGMNGGVCFHGGSVVIDDFDIVRAVRFPNKTETPLVIDTDGVLALPVALEGFQPDTGRDGEVIEFGDGVKLGEFPQGDTLDVGRERPGFPFLEEGGGCPASKGTEH